ncbi:malate synthase G [Metabacillus halosaccharovorans]|uniref:malate synthase G n=1 Tax=Metabacillus halosaccharovorans TaxID=930124 RepID=UPI001C1F9CBB|nr:malate synthase G [Metabacillus halosaccharovorans]MBU7595750.1 malate synthase G [Metabacillus halosaccharovorans]
MGNYTMVGNLRVVNILVDFINSEVLPGTGLEVEKFWEDVGNLINDLTPENKKLLDRRDHLQKQINGWLIENRENYNFQLYKSFLSEIGYLEPVVEDFQINTRNVDDEIKLQPGPQLVVPVNNSRYAINAANARWGSLYDALYGTDAISEEGGAERKGNYNSTRGNRVIGLAKNFLDEAIPLKGASHKHAKKYSIEKGKLSVLVSNGKVAELIDKNQLVGYKGSREEPSSILCKNNGLHIEIQIDKTHQIGMQDHAGVKDVVLESAITTIMDCEDSVAAVDADDKVDVYRNWLGLTKGSLTSTFKKNGKDVIRKLNPDRTYKAIDGSLLTLPGRSLMLIRNVGHLMTTDAVLDQHSNEVPEGILDCIVTSLIAKHDLLQNGNYQNSKKGSIYIVKPKMHGSEEVAFANKLFSRVEKILDLETNTLKIGVMDEERRTTINLKNCISEVRERIAFINTGFLDRTGDEIHTSMEAGPMIRKSDMKTSSWLNSYEKSNVAIGLTCGLQGRAQIGKGMWAMPDLMNDMINQKISHLKAGANTAWVPSPTAATLHAMHYHQLNVKDVQDRLQEESENYVDHILSIPIEKNPNWTEEEIQNELDNNAQGILGYVVRWIDSGIGCSKVKDINNVGLMEDRATLRISSQHMANWLHHQICSEEQVMNTLKRMAKVVDEQNAGDPTYIPMTSNFEESVAFQAAVDLIFKGYQQPNGYTEPILHERRKQAKKGMKIKS